MVAPYSIDSSPMGRVGGIVARQNEECVDGLQHNQRMYVNRKCSLDQTEFKWRSRASGFPLSLQARMKKQEDKRLQYKEETH